MVRSEMTIDYMKRQRKFMHLPVEMHLEITLLVGSVSRRTRLNRPYIGNMLRRDVSVLKPKTMQRFHVSHLVRHRRRRRLVDQPPGGEALERERRVDRVRLVLRHRVGENV